MFHVEKDIVKLNDDLLNKQSEMTTVEKKKEIADEILKEKKKDAGKLNRDLAKTEQDIREIVCYKISIK